MPELRYIRIGVPGEEGEISLPPKKHNDIIILHALAADVDPNLSCRQSRCFEKEPLGIEDVFVQDNQALARSSTYSGAVY